MPTVAWFDAPAASDEIDARAETSEDRAILESWVRHGYAIVEQVVPHDLIDSMLADLDQMFVGDELYPDVTLHDLVLDDGHHAHTNHRDLLSMDLDERVAIRDRSSWRVHGFYLQSAAADAVRHDAELRRIASMVLGHESTADYSINFYNGSNQSLHQDSCVFHLGVPNLICGAWVACEDIAEGSGPLVYFPGSHRREMFEGFGDYPQTNLRTADGPTSTAYRTHVELASDEYDRRTFLARKGDVLFWHGMLIHGGEPITKPGTTRQSFVVHFIPEGADAVAQVTGPTNW